MSVNTNEELFHVFTMEPDEQSALKVMLEFHAWTLLNTSIGLSKLNARTNPYFEKLSDMDLTNQYHLRIYSSINMAIALQGSWEKGRKTGPFKADQFTFQEIRKSFANYDLKNPPDLKNSDADLIAGIYSKLKDKLDLAALYCYTPKEMGEM